MKKTLLACSIIAATSMQAQAFKFDLDGDWEVRWDNTFKANVMSRVAKQNKSIYSPLKAEPGAAAAISDDANYSKNRGNGGIVSSRIDLLSELDVVWKDNFGFRISGAGWYDYAYQNSKNDHPSNGPTKGFDSAYSTWGSLTVDPGEYTDKARDLHYRGGELLDAFVFANFDIGDVGANIRVGRHTLYWGQSVLSTGAIHGFAGSMAALDVGKGRGAPGTEAKELFMPNGKVSTVLQFTDNLSLSSFYAFEFVPLRWPEGGTYFALNEVLTENSEFLTFIPGTVLPNGIETPRTGFRAIDYKSKDSGDWGVNLQYYMDAWGLETAFIYMNNTDRLTSGLYSTFGDIAAWERDLAAQTNASLLGHYGWVYKDDIDTFGISLSKEAFGVSLGADFVYRKNNALNPDLTNSLSAFYANPGEVGTGDKYPGPTGDTMHVVMNGIGFLDGEWGLWDGGSYIVEFTFSKLDKYGDFEEKANPFINEDHWVSSVGAVFKPTWYQVYPGWDLSLPMSYSVALSGRQAAISAGGNEDVGNASVGAELLIDQVWVVTAAYNTYFGPQENGTAAFIKDRDNISLTVKRTF